MGPLSLLSCQRKIYVWLLPKGQRGIYYPYSAKIQTVNSMKQTKYAWARSGHHPQLCFTFIFYSYIVFYFIYKFYLYVLFYFRYQKSLPWATIFKSLSQLILTTMLKPLAVSVPETIHLRMTRTSVNRAVILAFIQQTCYNTWKTDPSEGNHQYPQQVLQ